MPPDSRRLPVSPSHTKSLLCLSSWIFDLWEPGLDIQKYCKKGWQLYFTKLLSCSFSSVTGSCFSLYSKSFLTHPFPTYSLSFPLKISFPASTQPLMLVLNSYWFNNQTSIFMLSLTQGVLWKYPQIHVLVLIQFLTFSQNTKKFCKQKHVYSSL